MPNDGNTYGDRNRILLEIGFTTYQEYLESDLWEEIKRVAYDRYGKICRLCSAPSHVLHHIGYGKTVLMGEDLTPLAPLCDPCHHVVEFSHDGKKRSLREAQKRYRGLYALAKKQIPEVALAHRRCGCGNAAKKGSPLCRKCLQVAPRSETNGETVQITHALLAKGSAEGTGFTHAQLRLLGVFPPKKGWKSKLIGSFLPAETVTRFLRLRRIRQKRKKKRKIPNR